MANKKMSRDTKTDPGRRNIDDLAKECASLRAAEQRLRYDLASQRQILESSPLGISIISRKNPDKRLFVNNRMAEMFGYGSADDMLGFSASDSYVHQRDLDTLRGSGDGKDFLHEFVMERYRKDGSRWWCHLHRRKGTFEGEEVIIAWHDDITVRKLAEEGLRESQARYSSVVDGQSELISRFKPDGRFVFVNEAYLRFTGRDEKSVLSSTIYEDVPEDEVARLKAYFSGFSCDKPVQEIDNKLRRHDGVMRDIEWHDTAFFDDQDNVIEFQSVARDVTERRRAEKDLVIAKQQAQEANMAKSNFLATMSHEIRTPLNGVLGLAQLLRDTQLDQDQRQKVETILSSGQTLLTIINDVLDMSKIEAGGLELEDTAFSLRDLVATVATPFQSLADDRGLKLRVSIAVDSNLILKGDPVRLRQILWNLLSNAIKFTMVGGVTLTIKELEPAAPQVSEARDRTIMFAVEDTGSGISPDRIESIFGAFAQEDSSITRKFGGTGLGLSIVKQLTELMGGTIDVESEVDKSTVFTVYLPFFEASSEETAKISSENLDNAAADTDPLNVLVAEDNAVNAMIAKAFLEKFGHRVRHAINGKEAVAIVAEDWADMVLMDIHMPEMDGIEATEVIRRDKPAETLPIIGLTAEAFFDRHLQFLDSGMTDVLTKPYTEQQLAKVLRKAQSELTPAPEPQAAACPTGAAQPAENPLPVDEDEPGSAIHAKATAYGSIPIGDDAGMAAFVSEMDADLVVTLLEQAELSLQNAMARIREGLEISDCESVSEAAHAIKGSCGSMFAPRIARLAADVEAQTRDAQPEGLAFLRALLPTMEKACAETLAWWQDKRQSFGTD